MSKNFRCPYCNQPTTITSPNEYDCWRKIEIADSDKGPVGYIVHAITCPNPDCKKLFLEFSLTNAINDQTTRWEWGPKEKIKSWQLLPESAAKPLPDYIPKAIKDDYYEACRIKELSPKASATLSRRCLQGIIRDYQGIKKDRLKDEIDALEDKIDTLTWEAIDSVRTVGNIGAHMEKEIDLIIDVDSNEAQLLIELIEQLIADWYITRHDKKERLGKIKNIAAEKEVRKQQKVK